MPRNALLVAVLAVLLGGCAGAPSASSPATGDGRAAPAPAGGAAKPSFELTLGGVVELPAYASDAAAALDVCDQSAGGGWTYMYAGGDPFLSLDLSLYTGAVDGATPSDFDLDIGAPTGQVRLVPSGRREGAKGDGTARIVRDGGAVRIDIEGSATTMVDGGDAGDTTVALVLRCPG